MNFLEAAILTLRAPMAYLDGLGRADFATFSYGC